MARYQNLKDYLQNEHIKLIDKAVTGHQNSDVDINGNTLIESLYCTDDECSNLKMELVVSADCNNTVSEKQYYNVTLFGSLDRKLQDIQVIDVKKCDKSDIRDDDLLNHFILPDVRTDDLERIGNELFSYYNIFADMEVYGLSLGKIISNMKAPIFFADLPADCLGRINLVETDIKTYRYDIKIQQLKEVNGHAKPGIILLNKKKYYDEQDGELLITVAHELVHWQFHQKFFKLLVLLGTDSDEMNCKEFPVAFSDSMTDIDKALCIAEWQANALAMRLAIPSCTVDAVNDEIANDPSTYYENYGDRMQACVIKFAKIYGVSCFVAKARMRQLGYDFVDGTILEYEENGKKIQPAPFYFQPGILAHDETFVIYPKDYEKLVNANKDFAELIETRAYVYTGYVICKNDSKYIKLEYSDNRLSFSLSDYARDHAEECCMKFVYRIKADRIKYDKYSVSAYLHKLYKPEEYGIIDDKEHYILSDKAEYDMREFFNERYATKKILKHMEDNGIASLYETLQYHKERKDITFEQMSERTGVSSETIRSYFAKPKTQKNRRVSVEAIMIISNALQLEAIIALDLINKASLSLNEHELQGQLYRYFLTITNAPIATWNQILLNNDLPPLT